MIETKKKIALGSKLKWLPLDLELSRTRREREKGADRADGADLDPERRRGGSRLGGGPRGKGKSAGRGRSSRGQDHYSEYSSEFGVCFFFGIWVGLFLFYFL